MMNNAELKLLLSTPLNLDVKGGKRLHKLRLLRVTFRDEYVLTTRGEDLVNTILQVARLAANA